MERTVCVDRQLMMAMLEDAIFHYCQNETGLHQETNDRSTSYLMGQIDVVVTLLNEERGENESYYEFLNRLIDKFNLNAEKLALPSNDKPLKSGCGLQ